MPSVKQSTRELHALISTETLEKQQEPVWTSLAGALKTAKDL